jgi:hypothetical protein
MTSRPFTPLDQFLERLRARRETSAAAVVSPASSHYWRRTLRRAVASRRLAEAVHWPEGEEAFAAGLLADIGVAVLLEEAAEEYLPLYESIGYGEIDASTGEREAFGFDRRQLTRRLLADWQFPASIVATVEEADDGGNLDRTPSRRARLLYVAELIAAVAVDERADLWPTLSREAERHLRLPEAALNELESIMEEETTALFEAFPEPRFDEEELRAVLDRARRATPFATEEGGSDSVARKRETSGGGVATRPTAAELRVLRDYLRAAAITCRHERAPLALCLVEAEGDDEVAGESIVGVAGAACAQIDRPGALTTAVGPVRTAVVLPAGDRREALEWFESLRQRFRAAVGGDGKGTKLSVGIAAVGLPPRDLPVDEIIIAAERCLYAAQSSAGDAAKSIELY